MKEALTLNQLIDNLLKLREEGYGELTIRSQGCDCDGDVGSVILSTGAFDNGRVWNSNKKIVYIERTDNG